MFVPTSAVCRRRARATGRGRTRGASAGARADPASLPLHPVPSFISPRRALLAPALAAFAVGALAACSDDPTAPRPIAGRYTATTFRAGPTGQPPIDVLAAGGTLTVEIAADNRTSGTLALPAAVTGGQALTASMAGTAVRTGNTVRFEQSADTFVRDLRWTVDGNTLRVQSQAAGEGTFTIALTRP